MQTKLKMPNNFLRAPALTTIPLFDRKHPPYHKRFLVTFNLFLSKRFIEQTCQ